MMKALGCLLRKESEQSLSRKTKAPAGAGGRKGAPFEIVRAAGPERVGRLDAMIDAVFAEFRERRALGEKADCLTEEKVLEAIEQRAGDAERELVQAILQIKACEYISALK